MQEENGKLTRENFRVLMAASMEKDKLSTRKVAKSIGCSKASLQRILTGKTWPSDEFLKQGGL